MNVIMLGIYNFAYHKYDYFMYQFNHLVANFVNKLTYLLTYIIHMKKTLAHYSDRKDSLKSNTD